MILTPDFVTLKIFDTLGKEVETLVDEFQEAGTYAIHFNATMLPGGIYLYKLKVGNKVEETKKMLLIKKIFLEYKQHDKKAAY